MDLDASVRKDVLKIPLPPPGVDIVFRCGRIQRVSTRSLVLFFKLKYFYVCFASPNK